MDYEGYLDLISERAAGRFDIPALFEDFHVFESVIEELTDPFRSARIDVVAGIDALGFVLGTGVAFELGVGFLPIRKGGKLSVPEDDVLRRELTDYTGERKTLEIDSARVPHDARVLVVDDWMETAAQMDAATTLVEQAGGTVAGITVLDMGVNERSRPLAETYDLHTLNPETTV